ncbi:3-dehydroquinate synthase [Actinoplanes sp. SE50]|uniref:sedoheptulose 7-phosphate cyclase n=1 Tax=unclassified Actinoplanes TaxID=2626549 RepID=UPI00023ECBB7|nr:MULTISPECIES: sedoheptulose 7-phosphate cyclase [unclassified Actinoplanes]AEV87135.1 3-dehydroquinate synthase [Actinoplanes sp. SE50/110]ATO85533.1 3-dehydroquinate synthase [Actinoplanes sp. SE50]SLM02946.1 3-dehydroquinate synthase [Actinoplanes sp. SE50/110]
MTDTVGLAASLYRRGTPYVRIPTTLVGMIDAAIGAKTGINVGEHKNRLGTYYPATNTLVDPQFLRTLPARHVRNGMAEIIKMAIVKEPVLFKLLESDPEGLIAAQLVSDDGQEIMNRAITSMLEELEPNLWENELRRLVDFGHTFSPRLEMCAKPPLLHGEAVAIDMALCCALAYGRGLISATDVKRILNLLHRYSLPITHPTCDVDLLQEGLEESTRHRNGNQYCPLPVGIGAAEFVEGVTNAELARAGELLAMFAQAEEAQV